MSMSRQNNPNQEFIASKNGQNDLPKEYFTQQIHKRNINLQKEY